MDDLISRQQAIDAADRADYTGLAVEDVKKVTDEVVKELKQLPSAQPGVPDTNVGDIISRKAVMKHIEKIRQDAQMMGDIRRASIIMNGMDLCEEAVRNQPSAQPETKPIGYQECANAMLKMWIDNVLTDGEYNRIMDKLNAHHSAERRTDE